MFRLPVSCFPQRKADWRAELRSERCKEETERLNRALERMAQLVGLLPLLKGRPGPRPWPRRLLRLRRLGLVAQKPELACQLRIHSKMNSGATVSRWCGKRGQSSSGSGPRFFWPEARAARMRPELQLAKRRSSLPGPLLRVWSVESWSWLHPIQLRSEKLWLKSQFRVRAGTTRSPVRVCTSNEARKCLYWWHKRRLSLSWYDTRSAGKYGPSTRWLAKSACRYGFVLFESASRNRLECSMNPHGISAARLEFADAFVTPQQFQFEARKIWDSSRLPESLLVAGKE